MNESARCPACGLTTTLLALGTRWDRLHRWRPWILTCTQLSLCRRCDALVAVPCAALAAAAGRTGYKPRYKG